MTHRHDPSSGTLASRSGLAQPAAAPSLHVAGIGPPEAALRKDPLADVLRTVKFSGALFFVVDASSPWGLTVPQAERFAPVIMPRARHVVSYHIILEGSGWASVPGAEPVPFAAGDVIVFPHADPYAMASAPRRADSPDTRAALDFFAEMVAGRLPFVVTEGGGGKQRARFVCGFLGCDAHLFNPLLAALPRLLLMRGAVRGRGDLLDQLVGLALAQARDGCMGSQSIRLGLAELIFVEVVRRHVEGSPEGTAGWIGGLRDPGVGRVLALLHERPADPWSLETLARAAGMSRSVLAERFAALVGLPPLRYLTCWRMQLAGRLLCDGAEKVATVGRDVGYESEAAFTRSFKKFAGLSPAEWRKNHRRPP